MTNIADVAVADMDMNIITMTTKDAVADTDMITTMKDAVADTNMITTMKDAVADTDMITIMKDAAVADMICQMKM